MIGVTKKLYFAVDKQVDALVDGKNDTSQAQCDFFEGDSPVVNVYLVESYSDVSESIQLKDKETLQLVLSTQNAIESANPTIIAQLDNFDELMDEEGHIYYQGVLPLNTAEITTALTDSSSIQCVIELVVIDSLFGQQLTSQGSVSLYRSIYPNTNIQEVTKPAINIGSYQTVVSICAGIVDERILGLKDGAPAEFDTLYELADIAMRFQTMHHQVGDFEDYLEGKAMADAGFTVTELTQAAIDASTFRVSHSPSRPRAVDAREIP